MDSALCEAQLKNGKILGETGDETAAGSFCIFVLQHLARKYWLRGALPELCAASAHKKDWEELTAFLSSASISRAEFTNQIIAIYYSQDSGADKRSKIQCLFQTALGDAWAQRFGEMDCFQDGDIFYPIVDESDFYDSASSRLHGQWDFFVGFGHAHNFATYVMRRRGGDVIELINYVKKLEEHVKSAKNFDSFLACFEQEERDEHFYLVQRMNDVFKSVHDAQHMFSAQHMLEHMLKLKNCMIEALENELRVALCVKREDASMQVNKLEAIMQIEGALATIKVKIREEEGKLERENLPENEKEDLRLKIRKMKTEGAWEQVKCMLRETTCPHKVTLQGLMTLDFKGIFSTLLELGHVTPIDPCFVTDNLFGALECKTDDLLQLLHGIFSVSCNRSESADSLWTCYGGVVFLSDCVSQFRRICDLHRGNHGVSHSNGRNHGASDLNGRNSELEFHVVGSRVVFIDADFPKALGGGRNLKISGRSVIVLSEGGGASTNGGGAKRTINLSGADGAEYPILEAPPIAVGQVGQLGGAGRDGQSSGNLRIESTCPIEGIGQLEVICNGGNGGNGENGGDGGFGRHGNTGKHGQLPAEPPRRDLIVMERGEEGEEGKAGAIGGAGGAGGRGGAKGEIEVISNQILVDPRHFQARDGQGGMSGVDGRAGQRGNHGVHGKDNAYFRDGNWFWNSWERANEKPELKPLYAESVAKDVHLLEVDTSAWWSSGRNVKLGADRNRNKNVRETQNIQTCVRQSEVMRPRNPIAVQKTVFKNDGNENYAGNPLEEEAQNARNFASLCAQLLEESALRKSKLLEEIRLLHQVTVNMMENVQITACPNQGHEVIDPVTPQEEVFSDQPLSLPGHDPEAHTYCKDISEQIAAHGSYELSTAVEILVQTSCRLWKEISAELRDFIQILCGNPQYPPICFTLTELAEFVPKHFESLASKSKLVELIGLYSAADTSRAEKIARLLPDEGYGSTLRDILLARYKRLALEDYKKSLLLGDQSEGKGSGGLGSLYKGMKGVASRIGHWMPSYGGGGGISSGVGQLMPSYDSKEENQNAHAQTAEVNAQTVKIYEDLLTTEIIPLFRQLLRKPLVDRGIAEYFEILKTVENRWPSRAKILEKVTNWTRREILERANSAPFLPLHLEAQKFSAIELDQICGKLEYDLKFPLYEYNSKFVVDFFLDAILLRRIVNLKRESKSAIKKFTPSKTAQFDLILKIIASKFCPLNCAKRAEVLNVLEKEFASENPEMTQILEKVIAEMWAFTGVLRNFEVVNSTENLLQLQGHSRLLCSNLERISEQIANSVPKIKTFEAICLSLGNFEFSVQDLTQIENVLTLFEQKLQKCIECASAYLQYGATNIRLFFKEITKIRTIMDLIKLANATLLQENFEIQVQNFFEALQKLELDQIQHSSKLYKIRHNSEAEFQDSAGNWTVRAEFMTEALKSLDEAFRAVYNNAPWIAVLFQDCATKLVYFYRLKADFYSLKSALQSAWKQTAESVLAEKEAEFWICRISDSIDEILYFALAENHVDEENFKTKLQKLVWLGVSMDTKKLETQILQILETMATGHFDFDETLQKLGEAVAYYESCIDPKYANLLRLQLDKGIGCYNAFAQFFCELEECAESESCADWLEKLTNVRAVLILSFRTREVSEEVGKRLQVEAATARSTIMHASSYENVKNPLLKEHLHELRNLLLAYMNADGSWFNSILSQTFSSQKESCAEFLSLVRTLISNKFDLLLNCSRLHGNQKLAQGEVLSQIQSVKLRSHLFQNFANSRKPGNVQNMIHTVSRMRQVVGSALSGSDDVSGWIVSLLKLVFDSSKSDDLSSIINTIDTMISHGCGPDVVEIIEKKLSTETEFRELLAKNSTRREILNSFLTKVERATLANFDISAESSLERKKLIVTIFDGLNLLPKNFEMPNLCLKYKIWASLLSEYKIYLAFSADLFVQIRDLLKEHLKSLQPKTMMDKIIKNLQKNVNFQVELAEFYFRPHESPLLRKLLVRFSAVCTQLKPNPTPEDFQPLLPKILTSAEKLIFDTLPNQAETVTELLQADPSDWLYRLEYKSLCHVISTHFGSLEPLAKDKLKRLLAGWNAKFGGYQVCAALLVDHVIPALRLQPITVHHFLKVFEFGLQLSLEEIRQILQRFLPQSWACRILLKTILNTVVDGFGYSHSESCAVIKNQLESLLVTLEPHMGITLFQFIRDDLQLLTFDPKVIGHLFGQVVDLVRQQQVDTALLSQLTNCPSMAEWPKKFRILHYRKVYPNFTENQVGQISTLEDLLGGEDPTKRFVDLVLQRSPERSLTFDLYIQKLTSGDWIYSDRILDKIQNDPSQPISAQFDHYMSNDAELQYAELLNQFFRQNRSAQFGSNDSAFQAEIKKELITVIGLVRGASVICLPGVPIGSYTTENVSHWSREAGKRLRDSPSEFHRLKLEIVAVTLRAMHLLKKYNVRQTQILSLLLCIRAFQKGQSVFGQIATGEGKTDITGLLAVVLALCGKNVDVMSSGATLAVGAAKELGAFFGMFDVGVAEISSDSCRQGNGFELELGRRYKASVLYGTIRCFQADFLRNRYMKGTYVGTRVPDYVIVDEVDSLLLDKGSQVLFISYKIPELRYLRPCFVETWIGLMDTKCSAAEKKSRVKGLLKKKIQSGELPVPVGISDFVEKRLDVWVEEALAAQRMDEDEFYLAEEAHGEGDSRRLDVTIMDVDTGEAQLNSQYSHGRQQALQLRHGKRVTPECLKVIFISNHEFLKQFSGKLFGMTGTLGSERSKRFLKEQYNGDCFEMPRHRLRRCETVDPKITDNEAEFLENLKIAAQLRLDSQPCEIICPTVKVAKLVIRHFEAQKFDVHQMRPKIISYVSSADVRAFEAEFGISDHASEGARIPPNTIIVSTNLGGRGTDLKVSCDAGLHVILAYIPPNRRIRDQAIGRTARAGKRGSTQYVVRVRRLNAGWKISDYENAIFRREDQRIDYIEEVEIPKNRLEGDLFAMFQEKLCKRFPAIVARHNRRVRIVFEKTVKTRWAFWLDSVQNELFGEPEAVKMKFERFWTDIETDFGPPLKGESEEFKCCSLVSEHVTLGAALEESGDFDLAEIVLKKAAETDKYYNWTGNYYLGIFLLQQDRRREARRCLKQSAESLRRYERDLKSLANKLHMKSMLWADASASPVQRHYLTQLSHEVRVLQPHFAVLQELVGHVPISGSVFVNNEYVISDESEASLLSNAIIGKLGPQFLKPLRFSRKVLSNPAFLDFSKHLDLFERTSVQTCLNKIGNVSWATAGQRRVSADSFQPITIGSLWLQFAEEWKIKKFTRKTVFDVFYDSARFGPLEIEPPSAKTKLGHYLRDAENFDNIQEKINPDILSLLTKAGIVVEAVEYRGEISQSEAEYLSINQNQDEASRQKFAAFFQSVRRLNDSTIFHKEPKEAAKFDAQRIIDVLIQNGILKPPKINWSFEENFKKEAEKEAQIRQEFTSEPIKSAIRLIYDQFYKPVEKDGKTLTSPVEFDEYLESIAESFLASAGTIKRLPTLKVHKGFHDIASQLPQEECGQEVSDLVEEGFHRLPLVRTGKSWFCSGAFILSLLAVAQVVVGVALGVLSGGSATPLASLLVSEGVGDLFFAIQAGLTGNISWKAYGVNKAISVAFNAAHGRLALQAGTFATSVTKEIVREIVEKSWHILAQHAVSALGSTAIGIAIEKLLDNLRYRIVDKFRHRIKGVGLASYRYETAIAQLRLTIQNLFAKSYTESQAAEILQSSFDQLGQDENSAYKASLIAAVGPIAEAAVHKLSTAMRSSGNSILILGSQALALVQMSLRTFSAGSSWETRYQNFTESQLARLNDYLTLELEKLEVKRANREATEGCTFVVQPDQSAVSSATEAYFAHLENKLVDDGVEYLQRAFLEPQFKAKANRFLQAGCDSAFQKIQGSHLAHLNELTSELSAKFPGTRAGALADILPKMTGVGREAHSEYWLGYNAHINPHRLHKCGRAVSELIDNFGSRIAFLQVGRDFMGIFMCSNDGGPEEAALRKEAAEMGFKIVERLEF